MNSAIHRAVALCFVVFTISALAEAPADSRPMVADERSDNPVSNGAGEALHLTLAGTLIQPLIEFTGPGVPSVSVNIRSEAERDLRATTVEGISKADPKGSQNETSFNIQVSVEHLSYDMNPRNMETVVSYVATFRLQSPTGELFERSLPIKARGTVEWCWTTSGCVENLEKSLPATFLSSVRSAYRGFLRSDDTVRFVSVERQSQLSTVVLLRDIEKITASARVAESEAIIRTRPDAKARSVGKLPMESLVNLIGRLPNGWLQVAKEGEAVGWIHGGALSLVALQAVEPTASLSKTSSSASIPVPSAPALDIAKSDRRVALVIGNAAYPGVAALKNPSNDATDIAAKLKRLGFEVILRTNVGLRDMLRTLTTFGDAIPRGSEVLVYYAGHGMQVKGRNYLIPVDAEIRTESAVSSEAIDVDQLLDKLGNARLSMVILDACRNNPFERRFRGGGQGLAQINAPTGTLIAYATAPGRVAADGDGRNGLYTQELLTARDVPGIKIEDVFKRVRMNVVKKSGDAQTPWESSSLTGDFYFLPSR
ncbi:caspase family protein [uncultured Propionivibrio sp.]|uniref:caspase family protein n=1 Tax=uncultured Propionivibrio sp. TaxID=426737 RepID=UPI0029C053E3|nr:caspase family protein [uncultured Propionivibrio sp.]